jgi:hypothetical protein
LADAPTRPSAAEPEIIVGSREQLLHLLAEASEIEHTLMCSYLYAAFSLKRAGEPDVTEHQGEALERWRKAILDVAIEEMGHLVMVANLTVAVGGRPHFGRPNFPVAPGYFPSGVAVRLTGFNADTLDHFIFLERPQGAAEDDSEEFQQADYRREQASPGLMPSAQDYATIGHLYDAVRSNLIALHELLGCQGLFVGVAASQLGSDVLDLEGVRPVTSLAGAMQAIDIIVEQGEGSPADRDESHYRSFLAVRDELQELTREDATFLPAWPVADSPVLRQPPEPEGKVFIDHPDAARLLDFACATYGLLLRCLIQCFSRPAAEGRDAQKLLMSAAIDLMHVLGEASTALARLPASSHSDGVNAGMTFTMLRGVEPLPVGAVEKRLLSERARALLNGRGNDSAKVRDGLRRAGESLRSLPG